MKTAPIVERSPLSLAFRSHKSHEEQPVRACMSEGSLWFSARDICHVMKLNYEVVMPHFDATAPDTDIAAFEFDKSPELVLSPIGVYNLCCKNESVLTVKVAAWAKRQAKHLLADADPADPRLFLSLDAEGGRPSYPNRFTGRLEEWKELLYHPRYRTPSAILMTRARAELKAKQEEHQLSPEEKAALAERAAADHAARDAGVARRLASAAARASTVPNNPKI